MNREVELFEQALALSDESARFTFLQQACASDLDLLERLQRLLKIHEQTDDFMARPAPLDVAGLNRTAVEPHHSGEKIGSYELLEILGTGGMSIVWRARQSEPVRREVAIKLLNHLPRSAEHGRRVRREIRALALMQHPNVATILDAGQTEHGELYLVMELVEGQPVTDYCHLRNLPLADRLELLLEICSGVQHAHQRGIIHRDLKPANLLAFEQDGKSQVKIIDFGIAKLIDPEEATDAPTLAGHVIGTPQYMCPEQADSTPQPVDIRADVYALGVVLYELLTGKLPYAEMKAGNQSFAEVFRILREAAVIQPSHRGPAPSLNLAHLPVDLNWIVMRALAREPADRYASVGHLSDDIRHFLECRPVSAGPPTMRYRLSRWFRRHRAATAMMATLLLVLILASAISLGFAINASHARQQALISAQDARAAEKLAQSRLKLAQSEWARAEEALQAELRQREETEFRSYTASLAAAESAIGHYDTFEAVTNLSDAPEKFRSFEWWYLLGQVDHSLKSFGGSKDYVQTGHQGEVTQVAFHPNGNWLMTGGIDGLVIVWELDSGAERSRLALGSAVLTVRWMPSGKFAAAWLNDGRILLLSFNEEGQASIAGILDHADNLSGMSTVRAEISSEYGSPKVNPIVKVRPVRALEWSSDGTTLWAVENKEGIATLSTFTFLSEKPVLSSRVFDQNASAAAIHPGGLLAMGLGRKIIIQQIDSGQPLGNIELTDEATGIAFSPTANQLAVSSNNSHISVYGIPDGKLLKKMAAHLNTIHSMRFSPDGKWLASVSEDATLRTWTTDDFQPVAVKWGHVRGIVDVAFSPDSSLIATAGRLCAKIWTRKPDNVLELEWDKSKELQRVLTAGGSGRVLLRGRHDRLFAHDLKDGDGFEIDRSHFGSSSKIRDVAVSDDGRLAAWCNGDGELHLVSIDSLSGRKLEGDISSFNAISFAMEHLYASDESGSIWRYALNDNEFERWYDSSLPIQRLVVSRDGTNLAFGQSNELVVLETASKRELHRQPMPEDWLEHGSELALSDDGQQLIVTNYHPTGYQGYDFLSAWSVEKGWISYLSPEHTRTVRSVAWSRDNRRFATSSEDGTVKIWDREKLQVVLTLRLAAEVCHSLAFTDADQYLLGIAQDGKLVSWSALPKQRRLVQKPLPSE